MPRIRVKRSVAIVVIVVAAVLFSVIGYARYEAAQGGQGGFLSPAAGQVGPDIGLSNLYVAHLATPYETCLFVFVDGTVFTISTQEAGSVSVSQGVMLEILKKLGGVENIVLCVHNHLVPSGFSMVDNALYERLKASGFRGVFGIYVHGAKSLRIKTDLGWGPKAVK